MKIWLITRTSLDRDVEQLKYPVINFSYCFYNDEPGIIVKMSAFRCPVEEFHDNRHNTP